MRSYLQKKHSLIDNLIKNALILCNRVYQCVTCGKYQDYMSAIMLL